MPGGIAGVVVVYNPPEDFLVFIASYLDDVDILYVFDNSEPPRDDVRVWAEQTEKARYLGGGGNVGVAAALNRAAGAALERGYKWLLTMDQDSLVTPGMIRTLRAAIRDDDEVKVGIIAPRHITMGKDKEFRPETNDVLFTMTSGNLLFLPAYRVTGPFMDELFIDYVDHEYCLRLHTYGYRVVQVGDAVLQHSLGAPQEHRMFGLSYVASHHSALRRYYGTRNRLYVSRLYRIQFPKYRWFQIRQFWSDLVGLLLFEEQRLAKLRMILSGYLDYRIGRLGRYHDQW